MEIKINREIRQYTEAMFFGLSLWQLFFSLLAVAVAVGLFFLLRNSADTETVSWMCILGAAPFAALGFISYHGMTAEQFLWTWIRTKFIEPRHLHCETNDIYYEAMKDTIRKHEKENYRRHDEISQLDAENG